VGSNAPPIAAVELRIAPRLQTLVWQTGVHPGPECELGPLEQPSPRNKPRSLQTSSAAQWRGLELVEFNAHGLRRTTWPCHPFRGWISYFMRAFNLRRLTRLQKWNG